MYGYFKQRDDASLALLNGIGQSVYISRGAGLVLSLDCTLLLLPLCRNLLRYIHYTPLVRLLSLEQNINLHKITAYTMLFFTLVHVNAHYVNFFTVETKLPVLGLGTKTLHYGIFAGVTGHIMLGIMVLMYTAAKRQVKVGRFELFW